MSTNGKYLTEVYTADLYYWKRYNRPDTVFAAVEFPIIIHYPLGWFSRLTYLTELSDSAKSYQKLAQWAQLEREKRGLIIGEEVRVAV